MTPRERVIPAGRFKTECLRLLDEVAATGQELVVTKRGRPVARIVPARRLKPGALKGVIKLVDDVVSPVDLTWDPSRTK